MKQTLIEDMLSALDVPYTRGYIKKMFYGHPYRYTLYGIRSMLLQYGVKCEACRFKEGGHSIVKLETPFICELFNDLVVVNNISDEYVEYVAYGEKTTNVSH